MRSQAEIWESYCSILGSINDNADKEAREVAIIEGKNSTNRASLIRRQIDIKATVDRERKHLEDGLEDARQTISRLNNEEFQLPKRVVTGSVNANAVPQGTSSESLEELHSALREAVQSLIAVNHQENEAKISVKNQENETKKKQIAALRRLKKFVMICVVLLSIIGLYYFKVHKPKWDDYCKTSDHPPRMLELCNDYPFPFWPDDYVDSYDDTMLDEPYVFSRDEDLTDTTLSSSTATTRDELLATLNCSYIRDFPTAAPAIGGFTCASDGRKSHPMTIFQYVNSGGIAAKNARIKSAVEKACDHNREEVFVLSSPEIFVYTLSSIAVDSSPLADSFRSIKTGLCS